MYLFLLLYHNILTALYIMVNAVQSKNRQRPKVNASEVVSSSLSYRPVILSADACTLFESKTLQI